MFNDMLSSLTTLNTKFILQDNSHNKPGSLRVDNIDMKRNKLNSENLVIDNDKYKKKTNLLYI